jgi:lipopolysaccharide/colanic/teichoic acid biosynthesis glycosyltransferase
MIDILFSLLGLLGLIIMLPLVALLIKLDSRGPVFYSCDRVGLNGKIFRMYKFRTMYETPDFQGPSISSQGDPRVTTVGRVLRRLKLNEFPQFLNVLKGEMTLVGPRPETPDLAAPYPPEARRIFSVKPGLIGPNQILGRNEEELYPPGVDPQKFYIEQILPQKLPLDLQFIDNQSLFKNFKYLLQGALVTITGAIGRRHLLDNLSQIFLLLTDTALCLVSFILAHLVRYEGINDPVATAACYRLLPWAVLVRLPIFIYFGFYYVLIRHLALYDLKRVFTGVALASISLITVAFLSGFGGYGRGIFLIDWLCLTTLLIGYRVLVMKLYLRYKVKASANDEKTRVLIWGAGDCGELCLRFLQKERQPSFEVVGFIDDNPTKRGKRLGGVKVLGDRHHLEIISQLYKVQQVFIAIADAPLHELKKIMKTCRDSGLRPQLFLAKTQVEGEEFNLRHPGALIPANSYFSQGGNDEVGVLKAPPSGDLV